jgi:hypothetical protein
MRFGLSGLLLAAAILFISGHTTAVPRVAPPASVARPAPVLTAFRGAFGFRSRSRYYGYGYPYGSRYRYGYGRRAPGLLHRVVRTAAWLYILHLFFTHGGLSVLLWIIILGFVLSLARRRRRRRYAYRGQSWP